MRSYRARRRAYAVFFAAIFSIVGWADASGLHLCPQHDGLPVADSSTAANSDLAAPAEHAPPHAEAPGHGDHEGPCTCVGKFDEDGSVWQTILPAVAFSRHPSLSSPAETGAQSVILTPPQSRLPFANAPPHLI
jgi:hypothetical protein